jgi:hypothetical protein
VNATLAPPVSLYRLASDLWDALPDNLDQRTYRRILEATNQALRAGDREALERAYSVDEIGVAA